MRSEQEILEYEEHLSVTVDKFIARLRREKVPDDVLVVFNTFLQVHLGISTASILLYEQFGEWSRQVKTAGITEEYGLRVSDKFYKDLYTWSHKLRRIVTDEVKDYTHNRSKS